jgi:hypothetical protein
LQGSLRTWGDRGARRRPIRLLFVATLLTMFGLTGNALATTRTVTTTANSGPGSLRQVIASSSSGDVVVVPASSKHYVVKSEIPIGAAITIKGAGASSVVIDAGGRSRVFEITSSAPSTGTVTFRRVTITGGSTTVLPGGGAILVDSGSLKIVKSVLRKNTAILSMGTAGYGGGGAIYNNGGDTTIISSTLFGNAVRVIAPTDTGPGPHPCCDGGGALYENNGAITITRSKLNLDKATIKGGDTGTTGDPCCNGGGAIYQNTSQGAVAIFRSTLDHDRATVNAGQCCHGGGAIYLDTNDYPSSPAFNLKSSHLDYDTTTVTTKMQNEGCCSGGGAVATFGGIHALFTTFDHDAATLTGQECCNGGGAVNIDSDSPQISFDKSDLSHDTVTISGPGVNANDVCCNGGGALEMDTNNPAFSLLSSTLADDSASLSGTTISGGGAIYEDESTPSEDYQNSTIANNTTNAGGSDQGGGAIYVYNEPGAVDNLTNMTISGNSAPNGGGGGILNIAGDVHSTNTIIARNHAPTDSNCAPLTYTRPGGGSSTTGTFSSGGNNLENADTCNFHGAGDMINTNPLLGPLRNNGGTFLTMALLLHSPAIDAANNAACPSSDERDVPRPQPLGGVCDIGAFEASANVGVSGHAAKSEITVGQQDTVTDVVTNSGAQKALGVTFSDPAAHYRIDSVSTSRGTCTHTKTKVNCQIGTLPGGRKATVKIGVTALSQGTITLLGRTTSQGYDPTRRNNWAPVRIKVKAASRRTRSS